MEKTLIRIKTKDDIKNLKEGDVIDDASFYGKRYLMPFLHNVLDAKGLTLGRSDEFFASKIIRKQL